MLPTHPLDWPDGWPATVQQERRRGAFSARAGVPGEDDRAPGALTIEQATARILGELHRIDAQPGSIIISSNTRMRNDGLKGVNPGAAVRWTNAQGESCVLAIDIYIRASDNLAAIAATLCALRGVREHGGASVLARTMGGFLLS